MLNKIKRQFFSGLVIFVPISLTAYFFHLFFILTSETLLPILSHDEWFHLPRAAIRPISFCLTLFLIWLLGVIASNFFGKRLVGWLEAGIHRIPFFRGLYEAIQKMAEAFFGVNSIYQSAVLVEYPRAGTHTVGFVTSSLSGKIFGSGEPHYCVFIPTVPNPTSGILLYIPQSQAIHLDIPIEEVAKILVSHGFMPIPEGAVRRPA